MIFSPKFFQVVPGIWKFRWKLAVKFFYMFHARGNKQFKNNRLPNSRTDLSISYTTGFLNGFYIHKSKLARYQYASIIGQIFAIRTQMIFICMVKFLSFHVKELRYPSAAFRDSYCSFSISVRFTVSSCEAVGYLRAPSIIFVIR